MAGDIETLVLALNGAPIKRDDKTDPSHYFTGHVTIHNMTTEDDRLHFDLCFPTTRLDVDDYILSEERRAGTTDKVRLMLAGGQIDARVVAIRRRGAGSLCDDQGPEEYRLTFEVPRHLADAPAGEPLRVEFVKGKERVVVAAADGAV